LSILTAAEREGAVYAPVLRLVEKNVALRVGCFAEENSFFPAAASQWRLWLSILFTNELDDLAARP
jgi:hypothetical protein